VASADDTPIAETVGALLQSAQHLYEDERGHGEALDARLNQLTAFSGLLLTLIAPLGASQLRSDPGSAFEACYVASVILFAATALLAVSSTFRPRKVIIQGEQFTMTGWRRTAIKQAILQEYSGPRTAMATVDVQRQIIADLVASYEDVKELNGLKYGLVRQVSLGLCAGLVAIAAQAVILV
jgi:hypothetical protein